MVRYDFRYPSASEALQALKVDISLWHSSFANFITNTPAAVQNKPMLTKDFIRL